MKKNSKVIGVLVALVLVLCVAFGGTLAYLTATPGGGNSLRNTFTATSKLVENASAFTLTETEVEIGNGGNAYVVKAENPQQVTSQTYAELLQGMVMYKDPTVRIAADNINAQSYLFVVVNESNVEDVLTWAVDTEEFTDITTEVNAQLAASSKVIKDGYKLLIYKTNDANKIAIDEEVEGNIIKDKTVTVADVSELMTQDATLTFSAYLCQTAGFDGYVNAFLTCFAAGDANDAGIVGAVVAP